MKSLNTLLLIVLAFIAGSWCQANKEDVKTSLSQAVRRMNTDGPTEHVDDKGRRYHLTQVRGGKVWVPVETAEDLGK